MKVLLHKKLMSALEDWEYYQHSALGEYYRGRYTALKELYEELYG